MFRSCIAAFAMYSKIPMPRTRWDENTTRYSMCFFPLVGLVLGALEMGVFWLCAEVLSFRTVLTAAILTAVPLLVTGGIHMDGYLDTVDAISSWKEKEERLRILKDPHVGAFAVIFCGVLLLLTFGAWTEIRRETMGVAALGFVLSRSLSGLSVVTFPKAGTEGSVKKLSDNAPKSVRLVLMGEVILTVIAMIVVSPVCGSIAAGAALAVFLYYYEMSKKCFGGITGDVAGYFLCLCEVGILMATVIAGKV